MSDRDTTITSDERARRLNRPRHHDGYNRPYDHERDHALSPLAVRHVFGIQGTHRQTRKAPA